MAVSGTKNEYAKAVCYFLAEQLRVHKISLARAADIAAKFLQNINLVNSELDFLRLVKELSKDFEELGRLESIVYFRIVEKGRDELERIVRDCVVVTLATDPDLALSMLKEAIHPQAELVSLAKKFPVLNQYITKS